MNPTSEKRWLARMRWASAGIAVLLGLMFLTSRLGFALVGQSFDLLYLFRGSVPVVGVTIVYMDVDSEARLGLSRMQSWDRDIHARFLEILRPYHPRAVVFDVLFEAENTNTASDAHFVRAAAELGNVITAGRAVPQVYEGEVLGWRLARPFAALRDVTAWGMAQAADDEGNIRQEYHRADYEAPSLPWRVTERTGVTPLPDPFASRWINYYGPPGWFPHLSYHEVLENSQKSLASLSNQVIFVGGLFDIGFGGGKRSDDYRTPYTLTTKRRAAGVEISANLYLNLLRRDWLRRLPLWMEALLITLCGTLAGFALPSFRPLPATGWALIAIVVLPTLTAAATWWGHTWFPWLIVSAIQIPSALIGAVLGHSRQWQREKRALEQMVAMAQAGLSPESAGANNSASAPVAPGMDARSPVRFGSSARSGEAVPRPTLRADAPPPVHGVQAGASIRPSIPDHQLLHCIGKGAYGEVWLARDIIGSYHAVKVVYRRSFKDHVPFEREFHGIRRFTPISRMHAGFIHILHVGRNEGDDYLYYVMELGDDESSEQQIEPDRYSAKTLARVLQQKRRLPLAECIAVALPLLDALEYLHQQQLIHRDIKPSNIVFVRGTPKFADIGLVTDVAEQGQVTYLGTHGYIAPEGPGTPSADLFSFGRVLYECAFGMEAERFPELPTTLLDAGPGDELDRLNRILLKTCAIDPRQRYASAAEFRTALAQLQQQLPSGPTPTP